jgi:hypothetical protein
MPLYIYMYLFTISLLILLRIKLRALYMLGKHSTSELHPQTLGQTLLIKIFTMLVCLNPNNVYSIAQNNLRTKTIKINLSL